MLFKLIKTKKGFTLVETMIVVVVLAILSAVAVPMFINAYESQARKDCKNQVTVVEAQVKEAMAGMIDNGAAQYPRDPSTLEAVKGNGTWIAFSRVQDDHKAVYDGDDVDGNSDDEYDGKECFVLIKDQDIPGKIAFTISDLRGGYRPQNILDYNEGCKHGYYLKKKKLNEPKPIAFYNYLANAEIPVCPFADDENSQDYYYYIFEDGTVICSCPKCHED